MKRVSRLEVIAILVTLAAGLMLRLVGLDAFVVSDELRWTCRSIGFREALRQRDWGSTFRVGHPGVVTTWLGTVFIPGDDAHAQTTCRVSEEANRFDQPVVGETPEQHAQRLAELGRFLFSGRLGVALLTWLCIVGVYLLARMIWGPEIAVLSAILLTLDPFYLAHSRFLHLDAVLTGLSTLSVLGLLASRQRPPGSRMRLGLLAVSGAVGGLAILQKTPAGFLVPFTVLVLTVDALRQGVSRQVLVRSARDLVLWGLVVGVVYVALWPAMWSDPVGTVRQVMDKALGYAQEGHDSGNYFLGRPVQDPGWLFYPVAGLFRLSPFALIGLIAALVWLIKGGLSERAFTFGALLLYSGLFGVFISVGAKKFDRYLLPVFPALDIVAAYGLLEIASAVRKRIDRGNRDRLVVALACVAALVVQGALLLPHYPYYLTYYNPLLGGLRQAPKMLLVGWGEGYDKVAAYLNAKPDAQHLQVASPSVSIVAPVFKGEVKAMSRYVDSQTDYVVFYISRVQRLRHEDLSEMYHLNPQVEPEHIVKLHGVEYAWIYPNTHYIEPVKYVEEYSQPEQDSLLVDGDSVFAKRYQGSLGRLEFRSDWSPQEVAGLLEELPAGSRVWYARYPDADPEALSRLMQSRGLVLQERAFPLMEVALYQLVEPGGPTQPLDLRFENLRLRGLVLTDPLPAWGRDGGVFLEWEALQPLDEDYTVYLHLYDAHGQRITQGDTMLVDRSGRLTSQWEPGTANLALYHLPIPPGTPPGHYEMEVGVYLLDTWERLSLLDSHGNPQGTSVRLDVGVGAATQQPDLADLAIPHVLKQNLIPQLRLLGYGVDRDALLTGQTVQLRLFWQALGEMDEPHRLWLGLRGPDGTIYQQETVGLINTDYPTTRWRSGEVLHDRYYVSIGEAIPTGQVTLVLDLVDQDGSPVSMEPLEVTDLWVQSEEPSFEMPASIGKRCDVDLGDGVTLLGYDLDSTPVHPGENVHVVVYWQARQDIDMSYKVFVHLYDRDGQIVAQRDRLPGLDVRPTTDWEEGEILADRYTVQLDADVAPGVHQLAVGMYDPATGERLAACGPDGERLDQDRVFLGQVEIEP